MLRSPYYATKVIYLAIIFYKSTHRTVLCTGGRTAAERYRFLLARHPEIFDRAALQPIASYLDISQSTPSRLRAMAQQYRQDYSG
jgi:hypothetical protein